VPKSLKGDFANSVYPDQPALKKSRLIRIYTVCHSTMNVLLKAWFYEKCFHILKCDITDLLSDDLSRQKFCRLKNLAPKELKLLTATNKWLI